MEMYHQIKGLEESVISIHMYHPNNISMYRSYLGLDLVKNGILFYQNDALPIFYTYNLLNYYSVSSTIQFTKDRILI